jgi:uncharacterized membrane protein
VIAAALRLQHGSRVEFRALALAALAWFALHAGVAGSGLRPWLVARFGERGYRGGFSLASIASLWWLVHAYRAAPYRPLVLVPQALSVIPIVLVPVALVLLAGAFTSPSPTALGGEKFLAAAEPARGVLRITRHPFLWSVVVWAAAHLLVNADAGSLLFFSSLGLTALRGTFDIDRKRRRSDPEAYARFEAVTSNVPLQALLAGRTRLVLSELWLPLLLGLALAAGAVALHAQLFGAPAVPLLND